MTAEQQKQFQEMQELQRKQFELQAQQVQEQFKRNRPRAFANGLSTWTTLAIFFGILLGANVMASEVSSKTIITVLARPIARWELLLGKWLAIQLFGLMSMAVGVAIQFAAGQYLGFHFSSLLWLALLHSMVAIMLYSALALALGTIGGWMVAAGVAAASDWIFAPRVTAPDPIMLPPSKRFQVSATPISHTSLRSLRAPP
jgi:hypothetical protein